jgi:hypothetical protein
MKILSCGAGMQSTALALMSAENVKKGIVHPLVPVYDAIVFCDLNCEPVWVYDQVNFIAAACKHYGIPFYILESHIYKDQAQRIQSGKYIKMPLWTMNGRKKGKLRRSCTIDYKIEAIQRFVKYELLGYKKYQRPNPADIGAHEMHLGFSAEERSRIFDSKHPMFANKFPLADMGLERSDNYRYVMQEWGLETKASACYICPYHKNYFFAYLRDHYPREYKAVNDFDRILSERPADGMVSSELYLSYSCKRICELTDDECNDAQTFSYEGKQIWNGF